VAYTCCWYEDQLSFLHSATELFFFSLFARGFQGGIAWKRLIFISFLKACCKISGLEIGNILFKNINVQDKHKSEVMALL
jgi:hypothetical protein